MHVVVEATDRNGQTYTVEGDEFLASALCHELDHLDGILYLDKATNIVIRRDENKSKKSKKSK
jgi:peptide deformylase